VGVVSFQVHLHLRSSGVNLRSERRSDDVHRHQHMLYKEYITRDRHDIEKGYIYFMHDCSFNMPCVCHIPNGKVPLDLVDRLLAN
jgi:hypothetical protein